MSGIESTLNPAKEPRRHIVTVLLHDYFHRHVFNNVIGEKQWSRFESRLEKNVNDVCTLLDAFHIRATFFTLGWIAEKNPEIIKKLVSKGHEIASAGYGVRSIRDTTPEQFRQDIRRAKKALENAGANRIIGYRCAYKWFENRDLDLWPLRILAEEGHLYDASYRPPMWRSRENSSHCFTHKRKMNGKEIWEVPVATYRIFGFNVPISGGNYLRQFPHCLMLSCFKKWCSSTEAPFVLYFHPWELDAEQPRISSVGYLGKLEQYRNLGVMSQLLPVYFGMGQFQSIQQYLDIPLEYGNGQTGSETRRKDIYEIKPLAPSMEGVHRSLKDVTIVIPMFNEASSLHYLARTLDEIVSGSKNHYKLKFIFVDDGSTDETYSLLVKLFGHQDNSKIVRHEINRGISGALSTGIRAAETEIVCSIDADCSYDPLNLLDMIPLLEEGVDLVTASPYHRWGFVHNVPRWRLFLSKSLSRIYHIILKNKLATYTSCFRVYRRSSVLDLTIEHEGFLGIVELIAKLDFHGKTIREFPAILQCRIFGQSKMQVLRTIMGHLNLLCNMLVYRRNLKNCRGTGD